MAIFGPDIWASFLFFERVGKACIDDIFDSRPFREVEDELPGTLNSAPIRAELTGHRKRLRALPGPVRVWELAFLDPSRIPEDIPGSPIWARMSTMSLCCPCKSPRNSTRIGKYWLCFCSSVRSTITILRSGWPPKNDCRASRACGCGSQDNSFTIQFVSVPVSPDVDDSD